VPWPVPHQPGEHAGRARTAAGEPVAWRTYGEKAFGQALKGPGRSATQPLLPGTGSPLAMAIVVACVLVTAVQPVWLRHGMETGWLNEAIDAEVQASLARHPLSLAVLVSPGEPVPATAMAAALALVCVLRRYYRGAVLVAISVPLAAALTELVLKPLIGWTPWGNPFLSGHVTTMAALATALTVLPASTPARVPPSCARGRASRILTELNPYVPDLRLYRRFDRAPWRFCWSEHDHPCPRGESPLACIPAITAELVLGGSR